MDWSRNIFAQTPPILS